MNFSHYTHSGVHSQSWVIRPHLDVTSWITVNLHFHLCSFCHSRLHFPVPDLNINRNKLSPLSLVSFSKTIFLRGTKESLALSYCQVVFQQVNLIPFAYLIFCWWTSGFGSTLRLFWLSCYEHSCKSCLRHMFSFIFITLLISEVFHFLFSGMLLWHENPYKS